MPSAMDRFIQAADFEQRQRRNALAQNMEEKKLEREEGLRNILSGVYQAPVPAAPTVGIAAPGEKIMHEAIPGRMDRESMYGAMFEGGYGPEALKMQQKERTLAGQTPASVKEFEYLKAQFPEKKWTWPDYQDMKRQGWSIQDIAGVPTRTSTIPGRELPPEEPPISTLEKEVRGKAEITKGQKLGEIAGTQIKKALDMVPKITSNIGNLQEVVRLVEKEGASTGPLMARMPSFRQSSIELDNMQKQLGLDVIGSVTFGALSKGELDLALSKALPTHLKGPDLIDWANRKIAAQEKLRDYFSKQAQYLSVPGNTVAGWLEEGKPDENKLTTPQTQEDYNSIPSGALYIDPDDGKQYRKP